MIYIGLKFLTSWLQMSTKRPLTMILIDISSLSWSIIQCWVVIINITLWSPISTAHWTPDQCSLSPYLVNCQSLSSSMLEINCHLMMSRAFLAILSTKKVENIFRLLFEMKYKVEHVGNLLRFTCCFWNATIWLISKTGIKYQVIFGG